jgi:hypothetical protein
VIEDRRCFAVREETEKPRVLWEESSMLERERAIDINLVIAAVLC